MIHPLQPRTFRKQSNLWLARISELGRPLLRSYAALKVSSPITPPTAWKTGILLGANHIGDVLYRTTSLAALKRGLPDCSWFYLTAQPANEVLANNPHLSGHITLPPGEKNLGAIKDRILKVNGKMPDVAICYDPSSYWRHLVMAAKLGIPNRVAYTHKGFSGLVTHPISFQYPQSYPAYFRALVSELTAQKADWPLRPEVFPGQKEKTAANQWMASNGINPAKPIIACFCTTRQTSGVLPLEKFGAIFKAVKEQAQVQMILAGAKQDLPILQKVNAAAGLKATILAGDLDLLSLCALLQACRVVVTSDSGPRHLSNACGTPVVFVRNLSFSKVEAGAYLDSEYDFAPDREFVSTDELDKALSEVAPEAMAQQVVAILKKNHSGT